MKEKIVEYKIGKVMEVEIEGVKNIQVPVSITKQIGTKHTEFHEELPIEESFSFNVAIPVADLPAVGRVEFIKSRIEEVYQQCVLEQEKYKDISNISFS